MAFIDEVVIRAEAGRGGHGVVRWLRTKENAKGGPSGGDGGQGGSIVFEGVHDLSALARYRSEKVFRAAPGGDGKAKLQHGADGADLVLPVPVGTVIELPDQTTQEIVREGERLRALKGGTGGFGNAHFKGSTHQNPFEQTNGTPGEAGDIHLTLKLIADVGIVGMPNAGKSALLNSLTKAHSKVGHYSFTTLEPHLGELKGYILADIPGLIEGASSGRGLGTKFLRHIERTGFMLHLVSAEQEKPYDTYREVRKELEAYDRGLSSKEEIGRAHV